MLAMHLFVGNMQQNLVEGKSRDFYLSTEMIGLYQITTNRVHLYLYKCIFAPAHEMPDLIGNVALVWENVTFASILTCQVISEFELQCSTQ
jgi:hypothetical protein